MIAVGVAAAVAWLVILHGRRPFVVGVSAVASGVHPALGVAVVGCVVGLERTARISRSRTAVAKARAERLVAIELVGHGVSAGVSFDHAIEAASSFVADEVADELRRCLRLSRSGWRPQRDASPIEVMFSYAQASAMSGAPLAGDLAILRERERAIDETARRERLERIPVKMLFPLAFLILPGFLLVAVVPAVAGGLAKLTL